MGRDREPCINDGGNTHAWQTTGLDVNRDNVLCSTRRCVWCGERQEKPYGAGSCRAWRAARETVTTPGQNGK